MELKRLNAASIVLKLFKYKTVKIYNYAGTQKLLTLAAEATMPAMFLYQDVVTQQQVLLVFFSSWLTKAPVAYKTCQGQ